MAIERPTGLTKQDGTSQGRAGQDTVQLLSASDFLSQQEQSNDGKLNLVSLRQLLGAMLPQEGQPTRDQVRSMLNAVGQPQRLRHIIQSVLADQEQIKKIAERSYGHSTGMERIEIAASGPFSLRLHYWMPHGEAITEDPHNHVYDFGSKILYGAMVTDFYAPGDQGLKMSMFEIATQNTQHKPTPRLIDEVRLQPISPSGGILFLVEDPPYTMSHNVIHRVRQGNDQIPIITLNLRGGAVRDQSTFFRDETMQSANPAPTLVDVEDRLGLLLHLLTP